jgi:hypothetical protein
MENNTATRRPVITPEQAAAILGEEVTSFVTGGTPLEQASQVALDALVFLAGCEKAVWR